MNEDDIKTLNDLIAQRKSFAEAAVEESTSRPQPTKPARQLTTRSQERQDYYVQRRQWMTTAWLLGASYRQLGRLHEIRHETVLQAVDRVLSRTERQSARLGKQLTPTALSWYYEQWQKHVELLMLKTPIEAAQWLLTLYPFLGD